MGPGDTKAYVSVTSLRQASNNEVLTDSCCLEANRREEVLRSILSVCLCLSIDMKRTFQAKPRGGKGYEV